MPGKILEPHEMDFDDTGCLSDDNCVETEPIYFPDYQKVIPCCDPDWRWQRAMQLDEEGKRYTPETDDGETAYALQFIQALKACRTPTDREALVKRFPGLYSAYRLYTDNSPVKWVIEARILSGQSLSDVAQAMAISKDTVFWFQKLFFHVVPRLNAWDYICLKIIGKTAFKAVSPDDTETLLKVFGFHGGPYVLDLVISYLLGDCAAVGSVSNLAPKTAKKIRRVIELLSSPDDEQPMESLKDHVELMHAMKNEPASQASDSDFEQIDVVESLLDFDQLEEYEKSPAAFVSEEDVHHWEFDDQSFDSLSDSDEDMRENA